MSVILIKHRELWYLKRKVIIRLKLAKFVNLKQELF